MEELQEFPGSELVPYEPGLPLHTTAQATLGRFLPGTALSLLGVFAFLGMVPGPGEWLEALTMFSAGVGMLTLGFGVGLEGLRRWLYPDAKVCGRRSFVAGVMAPITVFVTGVLMGPRGMGSIELLGVLFLVALTTAVLMFFAWLTPTLDEMRGAEYEIDDAVSDHPG